MRYFYQETFYFMPEMLHTPTTWKKQRLVCFTQSTNNPWKYFSRLDKIRKCDSFHEGSCNAMLNMQNTLQEKLRDCGVTLSDNHRDHTDNRRRRHPACVCGDCVTGSTATLSTNTLHLLALDLPKFCIINNLIATILLQYFGWRTLGIGRLLLIAILYVVHIKP